MMRVTHFSMVHGGDGLHYVCMPFKNRTYVHVSYCMYHLSYYNAQTGGLTEVRLRRSWRCAPLCCGSLDHCMCVTPLDAGSIFTARPHGTVSTARAEVICSCVRRTHHSSSRSCSCMGCQCVRMHSSWQRIRIAGNRLKHGTRTGLSYSLRICVCIRSVLNMPMCACLLFRVPSTLYIVRVLVKPAHACVQSLRLSELTATSKC